jgi:hypothetical protein
VRLQFTVRTLAQELKGQNQIDGDLGRPGAFGGELVDLKPGSRVHKCIFSRSAKQENQKSCDRCKIKISTNPRASPCDHKLVR